jgi:tyrosinase
MPAQNRRREAPRVRRSIQELQTLYDEGDKELLETLWRAWKGIQELPLDDPRSFFTLGGYHGAPFRGAGWGSSDYWGGYCNHGNVLFPTWHRVYLLKVEEALQSIPGCGEVMLPYWDEMSDDSMTAGVPWAFTRVKVMLDGHRIDNPLRSFTLPRKISDTISDDTNYAKPVNYKTVRFPLAGLVGSAADVAATNAHNALFTGDKGGELLNANIVNWLNDTVQIAGRTVAGGRVAADYRSCLNAPNYTAFSNVTSAAQWNTDHVTEEHKTVVIPLERPHNSIHLAVGGFEVPGAPASGFAPIVGSSGDMSTTETAGLDPIFFFHHCFVDKVFWRWQQLNSATDSLEIMPQYPGTNSVDWQGPTPGTAPNSWLTLDSSLDPFIKVEGKAERPYTSRDCINIEKQLGLTYSEGSLGGGNDRPGRAAAPGPPAWVVAVHGINRGPIRGSFLVSVFGNIGGQRVRLGTEAVFSRWDVQGCANCQTHLETKSFVPVAPASNVGPMAAATDSALGQAESYEVEIRTYDGVVGQSTSARGMAAMAPAGAAAAPLFRLEVR